jgi:RimJ/RimL family protein N-acetyltransferase
MKYFKKMTGKKVFLSPINVEDAATFTEWLNDMEVTKYLTTIREAITLTKEREILEKMAKSEHVYIVVDLEINKVIGIAGLHHIDPYSNTCELGLFIGDKDYWNQGYGEEASRLLLDYAFNILNMHNIMLRVFAYNIRAVKCYEKIGFREIGRQREAYQIAGNRYDIIFMDLLSEDFDSSTIQKNFSEEYEESRKPKKLELI